MFMENLRLEHFKLAGFKLHTCKAINREENEHKESKEITNYGKPQVCQLQWPSEHFLPLTKNLIYYQAVPVHCLVPTSVISGIF